MNPETKQANGNAAVYKELETKLRSEHVTDEAKEVIRAAIASANITYAKCLLKPIAAIPALVEDAFNS